MCGSLYHITWNDRVYWQNIASVKGVLKKSNIKVGGENKYDEDCLNIASVYLVFW